MKTLWTYVRMKLFIQFTILIEMLVFDVVAYFKNIIKQKEFQKCCKQMKWVKYKCLFVLDCDYCPIFD